MGDNQQREALQATIWKIVNKERGAVDGRDFKQFVLGTLFYRFISENFSSFIKEHLKKRGITQTWLAKKLDKS